MSSMWISSTRRKRRGHEKRNFRSVSIAVEARAFNVTDRTDCRMLRCQRISCSGSLKKNRATATKEKHWRKKKEKRKTTHHTQAKEGKNANCQRHVSHYCSDGSGGCAWPNIFGLTANFSWVVLRAFHSLSCDRPF